MNKYFWIGVSLVGVCSLAYGQTATSGDPYAAVATQTSPSYIASPSLANLNVCSAATSSSDAATNYSMTDTTANTLLDNLCISSNQGYTNVSTLDSSSSSASTIRANISATTFGSSP